MLESSFWISPRQGENSKGDFLEIQSKHDRPDHEGMVYTQQVQRKYREGAVESSRIVGKIWKNAAVSSTISL